MPDNFENDVYSSNTLNPHHEINELKRQLEHKQLEIESITQEYEKYKESMSDTESELRLYRKQLERYGRYPINRTMETVIEYISDIYNTAFDEEDVEEIRNIIQIRTEFFIKSMKSNGMEITFHKRGTDIDGDDPVNVSIARTDDESKDGLIKSCDLFGCKFQEEHQARNTREHLTVFQYDSALDTNKTSIEPALEEVKDNTPPHTESTDTPLGDPPTVLRQSAIAAHRDPPAIDECELKRIFEQSEERSYTFIGWEGEITLQTRAWADCLNIHNTPYAIIVKGTLNSNQYWHLSKRNIVVVSSETPRFKFNPDLFRVLH